MSVQVTEDELKEILRQHNLWLANFRDGCRADLSRADLRGANLSRANFRGANFILIGQDIRGYLFWAFKGEEGVVVIRAGCRTFEGIAAARAHWAGSHLGDVVLREDCLSMVDRAERMATVRGWKLGRESKEGVS